MHDSILSAVTLVNRGSEVNNAENDWERFEIYDLDSDTISQGSFI
jgi:hypothetical protein